MTAADGLARALEDAHFMFGPHETADPQWWMARQAFLCAATGRPAEPWPGTPATQPAATTDTTTGETTR
ncbi:hypothetical protein [Embleya sp. NPDC001921]